MASISIGLREQKKALTRATLEATALERFLAEGYEPVRLEDLCAECLVSTRTFFRYFTSKEDLVLGRLRSHLDLATELFARQPASGPLLVSLRAVITETVADYAADPDRELVRLRLVTTTPVLDAALGRVFAGFERLVRRFAAERTKREEDARASAGRRGHGRRVSRRARDVGRKRGTQRPRGFDHRQSR
jgi:TetR/AcrR family transcriptional regulator, regulator of mycofactocin system